VKSDIVNPAGETALSQAQKRGHYAIVKLLSEHKNFISTFDGDEFTAPPSPEQY